MNFARLRIPAAVLAGAGVLYAIVGRGLVNYDTLYSLVWGRQITSGQTPDYDVPIAPTPHPLATLGGIVVSPLSNAESDGLQGGPAEAVVIAVAFLTLAILGWLVFELGREWFNAYAGALAAAFVLTRVPVLDFGARAYVDMPYLALILGALLVETRRPRAGGPVLILLALAGLLRPEAWLFSGAYLLWLAWPGLQAKAEDEGPQRWAAVKDLLPLALIAASGPLIWAFSDLLINGDPLHSLTGTRDNAELLGRVTGLDNVPETMPRRLGEILREPVLLAAAAGGLLVLITRRDRKMRLAVGAGIVSVLAFCVLAAAGLPIITRYLLLTATLLCLFAGAGVFAWMDVPKSSNLRIPAMAAAGVCALVVVAFLPNTVDRIDRLRTTLERQDQIQDRLADAVRPGVDCRPITVPNRRPIPLLALWLDVKPENLGDAQAGAPTRGTYVRPASERTARQYILDKRDRDRRVPQAPAGFTAARSNADWIVLESC